MEPVAVPSGSIEPLSEDTVLTVVEDFESLYDVPFVTVNRVDGEIQAEVLLSGNAEIDHDRLSAAMSVAEEHGFRAYARVFGDYNNVMLYFSEDPNAGLIWALETELGAAAW